MSNRVMHFEIQTPDPEKAIAFYEKVFGWSFEKYDFGDEAYWGVITGDDGTQGINGGLMKSPDGVGRTINVIDVPDINQYLENIVANGATIDAPKMPIEGMGWCAYFTDPTGHSMGVFQDDSSAN